MNVIVEETSVSDSKQQMDESRKDNKDGNIEGTEEGKKKEKKAKRPEPLKILQHVKFNTNQETPRSTIKGFLNLPNQADLKFTEDNLKKAEEQLKDALVEFYNKLRLLKSYSFLNIMAFSKIMKKYDKVYKQLISSYSI